MKGLPSPPAPHAPVVWSIAGTDSGGGAGLSADQRAADAFGVHLCPVVAAVTAQSTVAVTQVLPLSPEVLEAQLAALAADLPPRVIKTGLLGSAALARVVAAWVDRLRQRGPVALVVDPVLRASSGAAFADEALLQAYRDTLFPRATVVTPNQREAVALTQPSLGSTPATGNDVPSRALALQALGAQTVVITGGDAGTPALALDWLLSPQAQGWLSLPRVETTDTHGTGCTFASAMAAALARGFVSADAAVLAKMATTHALRRSRRVGQGAGPVLAETSFIRDASLLPHLSIGTDAPTEFPLGHRADDPGVYAIVDSAERVESVLRARPTTPTIQLRLKRSSHADLDEARWQDLLDRSIRRSQTAAAATGVRLVVNDHWQAALAAGVRAIHLGQEDLLALDDADRATLADARARGLSLGLSSHSLWELCRAAGQQADLIACGPIWSTTTKDMPWTPQGLDNLAWWAHMAPAPVVGIGGILEPSQLEAVAAAGAAGGCVVRGLGEDPARTLPAWMAAWERGRARAPAAVPTPWPHPSLTTEAPQGHT